MKNIIKKLTMIMLSIVLIISSISMNIYADEPEDTDGTNQVIQKVDNAGYSRYYTMTEKHHGETVTFEVYCLNSSYAWPDANMDYKPDLDSKMSSFFKNKPDVQEKVRRALYAGFPNNGAGLYEIIDSDGGIGVDAFNKLIKPSPEITEIIKSLKKDDLVFEDGYFDNVDFSNVDTMSFEIKDDNSGSLNDVNNNEFKVLMALMMQRFNWKLSQNETDQQNLKTLESSDCYQPMLALQTAWSSDGNTNSSVILSIYNDFFNDKSFYVSIGEAYHATQLAVWQILYDNQAPENGNDQTQLLNALSKKIIDFANSDTPIPDSSVDESDINELIDLTNADGTALSEKPIVFTKDFINNNWKSQELIINGQSANDKPIYELNYDIFYGDSTVPVAHIQNDKPFVLVLDSAPTDSTITIRSELKWPSKLFVYGTEQLIHFGGENGGFDKHAQNMGGLYLKQKNLAVTAPIKAEELGSITISKIVIDASKDKADGLDFNFELSIPLVDENGNEIQTSFPCIKNQQSSDTLDIDNGKLYFSLGEGESIVINELPLGLKYQIIEASTSSADSPIDKWVAKYVTSGDEIAADTKIEITNRHVDDEDPDTDPGTNPGTGDPGTNDPGNSDPGSNKPNNNDSNGGSTGNRTPSGPVTGYQVPETSVK